METSPVEELEQRVEVAVRLRWKQMLRILALVHDDEVDGDFRSVRGNGNRIKGDHCLVFGNDNSILGDDAIVLGSGNSVRGRYALMRGDQNRLVGDEGTMLGDDCVAIGKGNRIVNWVAEMQFTVDYCSPGVTRLHSPPTSSHGMVTTTTTTTTTTSENRTGPVSSTSPLLPVLPPAYRGRFARRGGGARVCRLSGESRPLSDRAVRPPLPV
jgi:hypothetical protein